MTLKTAYEKTAFQFGNHGKREVALLNKAFQNIPDNTPADMYGNGEIITAFETKMARFLGKGAALFFPSGTMAQQIALRIHCDDKALNKVAYHPLSHLEIHESDGLKELHHIETILLADKDHIVDLTAIQSLKEHVAAILLELPQREIGGQLPKFDELERIAAFCKTHDIRLHLDGARLLEILPYYKKEASQIAALFDSVYVSFYKGIGSIAGAILAGDQDFIDKAMTWKKRYGGNLISLYPYIIPADYYFDLRVNKMELYYEAAKKVAVLLNECPSITTVPQVPVSNMFHIHFHKPIDEMTSLLIALYEKTNIGLANYLRPVNDTECSFELNFGDAFAEINPSDLKLFFTELNKLLT